LYGGDGKLFVGFCMLYVVSWLLLVMVSGKLFVNCWMLWVESQGVSGFFRQSVYPNVFKSSSIHFTISHAVFFVLYTNSQHTTYHSPLTTYIAP